MQPARKGMTDVVSVRNDAQLSLEINFTAAPPSCPVALIVNVPEGCHLHGSVTGEPRF